MKEPLSFQEKQNIVSLVNTILILGLYSLYVYQKYLTADPTLINNLKFWGQAFLMLIPITIVVQVIIHIVFVIINKIVTNEDAPNFTDERDKMIDLKALRASHWVFILGFFLAMGSQAIDMQPYIMFFILIASGFTAGIVSDVAKIYFYRKGI
ncbi:MAG: hypothetical protein Q8S18_07355 [Bacteroidales bacterium]|nr:hypothetical protein [Bacteroidales bacterium]